MPEERTPCFRTSLLARDGQPDLKLEAHELAHVSSERPGNDVWTELFLYRTKGGALVAHKIGRSRKPGHRDKFSAVIADDDAELVQQLGRGTLSQELYSLADIQDVEELEPTNDRFARETRVDWVVPDGADVAILADVPTGNRRTTEMKWRVAERTVGFIAERLRTYSITVTVNGKPETHSLGERLERDVLQLIPIMQQERDKALERFGAEGEGATTE